MKILSTSILLAVSASLALAAEPAPKKPTPKPAPKPQPTVKDLALQEAKKFDVDHNGKISGTEVIELQNEFRTNPNSHLYLFDDNSNHVLDDAEIAKIQFGPAPKKPEPKGAKKPAPKKH